MARAIWKGVLSLEGAEVPVKLYSAVQDRSIHFRLLDAKHKQPIQQKMVDPQTGDVVEYADVRRGYQTEDGELVILDPEDRARAERERSGVPIEPALWRTLQGLSRELEVPVPD